MHHLTMLMLFRGSRRPMQRGFAPASVMDIDRESMLALGDSCREE